MRQKNERERKKDRVEKSGGGSDVWGVEQRSLNLVRRGVCL